MALEYMDGGSLADLLSRGRKIGHRILAIITSQVLKGLQYLQKELNLVHRGIFNYSTHDSVIFFRK